MMTLAELKKDLAFYANPEKALFFPRFFKTGVGQYGEGDHFLGITVPDCRMVAKKYLTLSLIDTIGLLNSSWHEERLTALLILVMQFDKATPNGQEKIYSLYLANSASINNWDLVDLSCRDIVGRYLYEHPDQINTLDHLAKSTLLWDRRIAMISTFYFLLQGDPSATQHIAGILLTDGHDLIQKATGWMLRELGKRVDESILVHFLAEHYDDMPRTTLRYAIERFSPEVRRRYLSGDFTLS